MSIQTSCPNCQAKFKLDDELSGKKVRCQKCKAIFTVTPLSESAAESVPPAAAPVAAAPGEVVFSAPSGSPGLGNMLLKDLLGDNEHPAAHAQPLPPAAPVLDDLEEVPAPPAATPVPAARPTPPPVPNAVPPMAASGSSPTSAPAPSRGRISGWSAGTITLATILYLSVFLGGIGGLWALAARRASDVSLRIPRHFQGGNRAVAITVPMRNGVPDFVQHSNLDFGDPQLNAVDGFTRYKVYEVTFEANQSYFIEMRSHNFAPRLVLLDENGGEVAQFDAPVNFNFNESRATLNYFSPRRGKHLILATGRRNNGMDAFGAYDFRVRLDDKK